MYIEPMNTDRIIDHKAIKVGHTYLRVTYDMFPITVELVCIKGPWVNYGSLFFDAETYRIHPGGCEQVKWDTEFSVHDFNLNPTQNGYNFHGLWEFTGDNLSALLDLRTEEEYMKLWKLPVRKAELRKQILLEAERAENFTNASEKHIKIVKEKQDKAREALRRGNALAEELAQLG